MSFLGFFGLSVKESSESSRHYQVHVCVRAVHARAHLRFYAHLCAGVHACGCACIQRAFRFVQCMQCVQCSALAISIAFLHFLQCHVGMWPCVRACVCACVCTYVHTCVRAYGASARMLPGSGSGFHRPPSSAPFAARCRTYGQWVCFALRCITCGAVHAFMPSHICTSAPSVRPCVHPFVHPCVRDAPDLQRSS